MNRQSFADDTVICKNLSGARIASIEIKKLFLMVLGKDMCFVKRIAQDIRTIGSVLMGSANDDLNEK